MDATKGRIAAETVLFLAIEVGVLLLLLLREGVGLLASAAVLIVSLAYGAVAYFAAKPAGAGTAEELLRSNGRRIAAGMGFLLLLTAAYVLFPARPVNLLAVFAALDVLVSLVPGKGILAGSMLWTHSRFIYLLVLIPSAVLLLAHLFAVPPAALLAAMAAFSGNLFLVLAGALLVLIMAGLLGWRHREKAGG